ncbi:MAG: hypothetical protein A3F91_14870 [Flavobacteria bacterium RIFCSPLOWO2_12_FULL_35_11]|nr:MAG: hypothetical protein A3F91_14870 [Flavobacteria bacterium RIFCSPLOWO2_12_FULL_35_11]
MIKQLQVFGIKLLIALSIVFGIHSVILYFLGISIAQNLLIPSYITNYFLALLIFFILVKLKKKYLDLLGFVFMAGSFVKFGVYFIFFNPVFKQNGLVSSQEATAFLTPYLLCLIVETFYLIKLLNNKM